MVEDPEVYYTSGPHYVVDVHAVYTATRLKPSARGGAEVLDCFGANARAHQDWSVGDTQEVHFDNGLYYRDGGWALTITDRPTRLPNAAPHPFKRGTNGHPGV